MTRLAAETESDQNLLKAVSEIELGEPYDALPGRANQTDPGKQRPPQRQRPIPLPRVKVDL